MKLIKKTLYTLIILYNTAIFNVVAQDNAEITQNEIAVTQNIAPNDKTQTSTLNPLESLYAQFKEFGKVTVDPANLENTIALLKENIARLEQKKPSLRKIFMYYTGIFLNIGTFLLSSFMTFIFIPEDKEEREIAEDKKFSYLEYWQKFDTQSKTIALLSPLLTIASPFTTYYLFKKVKHTFESVQNIANDIALNKAILSQLEKKLQRIPK